MNTQPVEPLQTIPGVPLMFGTARQEYTYHGIMLLIAAAIILLSFLMRSQGQALVYMPGATIPMPDTCASRVLFGTDCPSCGLTRAFISISHGQWMRAWSFNPAGFVVYAFVFGQIPWRLVQIGRVFRGSLPYFSMWLFLIPASVFACMIAQWVEKIFLH